MFNTPESAEKAINYLHNELDIDKDELSYLYRNEKGESVEVAGDEVASDSAAEGAADGATTGAGIGALIGLAAVAGIAGPLGPVLAAGPIATAVGLTGAVGTVATGAIAGAAVGGLVGALTNMSLGEAKANEYRDQVIGGKVLVTIHTEHDGKVVDALREHGANDIEIVAPSV